MRSARSRRGAWTKALGRADSTKRAGKRFSGRRTVVVEQALRKKTQRHAFCGRILGIDPSLRGTGLAVLEVFEDYRIVLVYSKTLKIPARESLLACTGIIHQGIVEVLNEYQPELCAAEQTIYVQNFQTAQIMGIARGAILSAIALAGKELHEYAPLRIKQAVCGYGRASKEQVARMVQGILRTSLEVGFDETDAAAAALCCLWDVGN